MAEVDLLVVGGGINGVAVAQAAAAAGYSVCLLERETLGSGTSSQSSKLIHGGLRYLESGQIALVYEALQARRLLLKLAPSLVRPVAFYIPIYADSRRSALTIRAGLSLYRALSLSDPLGCFRQLPAREWSRFHGLKLAGMTHMFQYWDGQTDDRLLTQAVARSAEQLGARILQHSHCQRLHLSPQGAQVEYHNGHGTAEIFASMVVNCSGAWVNELLAQVSPPVTLPQVDWVQGSHLLLDIAASDGVLYLESCYDERVIFVMPWQGKTLLGTTETVQDNPHAALTSTEQDYLLGIYRHYFPFTGSAEQLQAKIIGTFSGMRVLPHSDAQAFGRTREVQWLQSTAQPRLLSLYGGKLTTFHSTAKKALQLIRQQLGPRQALADVDQLPLG